MIQSERAPGRFAARIAAEAGAALIGIALLVCAAAADQRWLDRHFLPAFFATHGVYVLAASFTRFVMAALGVGLALRDRSGARNE